MKYLFWSSVMLIVYTYAGYPAWLWVRARLWRCGIARAPHVPTISVVMVVRNEEQVLPGKLQSLCELDYPGDKINFVVVSDASTDRTHGILTSISDPRFRILLAPERKGKASGLNQAIGACTGEIVLFTDARQMIERGAVRLLMESFADPTVGCASGELMLGDPSSGEASQGMGLYWRVEKTVRGLESACGSVVGATGALYAVRKHLVPQIPDDTILDDVYIPMQVAQKGQRVVFDDRAHAWDRPNLGDRREFARKVRTLTGNYQLLQLAPWLLTKENPLRFEFISHKLLRLVVPFALAAAMITSFLIGERLYSTAGVLQLAFYALSILGFARLPRSPLARMTDAASTFVVLNAAALIAFKNFAMRRRVAW